MVQQKLDISVYKVDESTLSIKTDGQILNEIKEYFSNFVPNYRFMPAYKMGKWDGKISALTKNNLPIGLLNELKKFAIGGDYSIYISFDDKMEIDKKEFSNFISDLQLPFDVYDYQELASYEALQKTKLCINIPTSGGKSLIQYIIASFITFSEMKILIIVPTIHLVDQLFKDFIDYGMQDPYDNIYRIYGGQKKTLDFPISISTWQSLMKIPKSVFSNIDCLMIDEAHGAKGTEIQKISKKCNNSHFRIGLSGTFPKEKSVDWFTIVGALGPVKRYVDYKKLREDKRVAGLNIKDIMLNHPPSVVLDNFNHNNKDFMAETSYINNLEHRNQFIVKLVNSLKGNTIVLFTRIEQGKNIENALKNTKIKKILYVDGGVDKDERGKVRDIMEKRNDIVTVASYGTFSTGVNIKNVHNIVLASNYKSKIKVIQSIGRGLRISDTKDEVTIYDLVDNLRYDYMENKRSKKYINYSLKHYVERQKFYKEEGYYNVQQITVKLTI